MNARLGASSALVTRNTRRGLRDRGLTILLVCDQHGYLIDGCSSVCVVLPASMMPFP